VDDLSSVLERLEAERQQALRRLASLTRDFDEVVAASRDTNADDEHDPEGATIAFERSQIDALVRQAHRHLEEIDAAVQRVETDIYGACDRCGRPIGEERLAARPTARDCIVCAASARR
jgi:DnaK suppressor protein